MKPEYWDALFLGLAIGLSPLLIGAALIGLYCAGLFAWFWFLDSVEWLRDRWRAVR